MIVRKLSDCYQVEWGNGISRRFLVEDDGMGYTVTDTIVRAGTSSGLEYKKHFEACYCISGRGQIEDTSGNQYPIEPGILYALDQHDRHYLIADPDTDLRLICVFAPALRGDERHQITANGFSYY